MPGLGAPLERAAPLRDDEIDELYPVWVRRLANVFWTPVDVARRAAELLDLAAGARVLDVGAGPGKFCIAAALSSPATFVGVEQRAGFVEVARQAAATLGARRAEFVHGNAMSLDWRGYQGIYLFNPFAEDLGAEALAPALDGGLSEPWLFSAYVRMTRVQLELCAPGTKVVTYHGFGGEMPEGYRLVHEEEASTDWLRLWRKEAA